MSPATVDLLRWATLGFVLLAFAGLAWLFVRKGSKIRSDAQSKPPAETDFLP